MAQLPKGGLVSGYDKSIHGSCAIYEEDTHLYGDYNEPMSWNVINIYAAYMLTFSN